MSQPRIGQSLTTFEQFVVEAQPRSWQGDRELLLEKWFEWPPDVFAMTSLVFSATGAYRRAASPGKNKTWPRSNWKTVCRDLANQWRNWVADRSQGKHPLSSYLEVIRKHKGLAIDALYDPMDEDSSELCFALLDLHAIADEAMWGVGVMYAPRENLQLLMRQSPDQEVSQTISAFYLQANYLLALRGSLSRIPKYRGVIVPKSRTPQVGLTLRSFSANLTYHQTEVDISWRAFPWLNSDENIVNIMIVPWPFQLQAHSFDRVQYPHGSREIGHHRYFHYEPKVEGGLDCDALLNAIDDVKDELQRVHIMIFPEMALRQFELRNLKRHLEARLELNKIPMIITGISDRYDPEEDPDEVQATTEGQQQTVNRFTAGIEAAGFNRVVLSFYYAGRWHDLFQDKHHRWKVAGSQIEQYRLGSILSGGRSWWEAIQITRRQLSVLSANSWLTICPLICEDLARLDPVSEVLRGIGPTLLTALLLDGPQLKDRWSARYASVFAEDPGSSVLTVTALGMSGRSFVPGDVDLNQAKKARESQQSVGLWKDEVKNWRTIKIDDDYFPATFLSLSAEWKRETTFDGRSDPNNSAVFTYQGSLQSRIPWSLEDSLRTKKEAAPDSGAPCASRLEKGPSAHDINRHKDGIQKKRRRLDMCELTLFTYFVDTLIEAPSDTTGLAAWIEKALHKNVEDTGHNALEEEILELLRMSIENRDLVPIEIPSPHLLLSIQHSFQLADRGSSLPKGSQDESDSLRSAHWERLKDAAVEHVRKTEAAMRAETDSDDDPFSRRLKESYAQFKDEHEGAYSADDWEDIALEELGRIDLMTPLSILWAIHVRLTARRRMGVLRSEGAKLFQEIENVFSGASFHQTYQDWRESKRRPVEPQGATASTGGA